jgi:hypothetical protein
VENLAFKCHTRHGGIALDHSITFSSINTQLKKQFVGVHTRG